MNPSKQINVVLTFDFSEATVAALQAIAPNVRVHKIPTRKIEDIPAEILAQADVYYSMGPVPTPEAAPNVRMVQYHWAGVDRVLRAPIFGTADVRLANNAGVHAIGLSEYALTMMLAFSHKLPRVFEMKADKHWPADGRPFWPDELYGATVGLVGYGSLGGRIAKLCVAFGMRVLAMRRSQPSPEEGVTFLGRGQLDDLLRQSDYVVLAVPNTAETRNMIDARAIGLLKPNAVLMNIARGAVVDEAALIEALRNRRIAGAVLDVFQQEPLPDDSPFWQLDNVILTPHMGGYTHHYEPRAAKILIENVKRFAAGAPLVNQVDFERGY